MRPIYGLVYLQGAWVNKTWEQKYAQVVHQFAHILAFNGKLLPFFETKQGEFLGTSNVLGSYYRRNTEVSYLKSENTLKRAKTAFSCNNLYGLDLDSQVSELGSNIHWEKRLMFNDFMVPDSNIYYVIFSDVSFAVFEDSGWYQVNYDYSDTIV